MTRTPKSQISPAGSRCLPRPARGLIPLAAIAVLCAMTLFSAAAPAQAQQETNIPIISIERVLGSAVVAVTDEGVLEFKYRLRAVGTHQTWSGATPGCNREEDDHGGCDRGPEVQIDYEWKKPWLGKSGLPASSKQVLAARNAEGEWYWDEGWLIVYHDYREDRPLIVTVKLKDGTGYNVDPANQSLKIFVNPQISLQETASATEGTDANMEFQVTLNPSLTGGATVTVDYETYDISANAGSDYTAASGTLTFNKDHSSRTISVPITDDNIADDGETFGLRLSNPSGVTRLVESFAQCYGGDARPTPGPPCHYRFGDTVFASTLSATGTILNTEPGPSPSVADLPEVSIRAASSFTQEGSDAVFTLTRTLGVSEALQVPVSVQETDEMLDPAAPTSATFASGEWETELRLKTVDDAALEADSTVVVEVRRGSGYRLGANAYSEAAVTVLDDDAASLPEPTPTRAGVEVWSADMTVVDYENGSIGAGAADLLSNQRGSEGLEAKSLWYYAPERKLRMSFTAGVDTRMLKLFAGDHVLTFPEARSGESGFSWENVDVNWTDGQTIALRLERGEIAAAAAPDPTLKSLAVSGADLSPAFDPAVLLYEAVVGSETSVVTVSTLTSDEDAEVMFGLLWDADSEQAGHQVNVPYGETLITASVAAADGETQRAYRVLVKRPTTTVAVTFESESYTAIEGGDPVSVVVQLSADPGMGVTIPLTAVPVGGAVPQDYRVPARVTFMGGGALSQTVELTAVSDDVAEVGESVALGFAGLSHGLVAGGTASATVLLMDAASTAAPPTAEPTGAPVIRGTPRVGETLDRRTLSGIDDAGRAGHRQSGTSRTSGLEITGTTTRHISGRRPAATHTLTEAEEGKVITVTGGFHRRRGQRRVADQRCHCGGGGGGTHGAAACAQQPDGDGGGQRLYHPLMGRAGRRWRHRLPDTAASPLGG